MVELSYKKDFDERNIPTKAYPIQINKELLEFCKKKIQSLLEKRLTRFFKFPWSYATFYIYSQTKNEQGVHGLFINYKPLNKVLQWISYPIPPKKRFIRKII